MSCISTILFVLLGITAPVAAPREWQFPVFLAVVAIWSALDDIAKEGR